MKRYSVRYSNTGFACNQRWIVFDRFTGRTLHRGPRWACDLRARFWPIGGISRTTMPNGVS